MLSKKALEVIAQVFHANDLRLPPEMWEAGVEIRKWVVAEMQAAAGESPKGNAP